MKKFAFLIAAFFLIQSVVHTQSCLPEGITFTTQAQIDSFPVNYPGCSNIEGDILISGYDISNLLGLSVLTSVGGTLRIGELYIGNPMLINLNGLDNIDTVFGNFYIRSNENLLNLNGLTNLTHVEEDFVVDRCNSLTNLSGMDNLNSVSDMFKISYNNSLINLIGIDSLTIVGQLFIDKNENLINLNGVNSLNSISGSLLITNNFGIQNLDGISSLVFIGEHMIIENNDFLKNINGLENLTYLGGEIYIIFNSYLSDITGINNIEAETLSKLEITNNSELSDCDIKSICDYLALPNADVLINDNEDGCNSVEEVEQACFVDLHEIQLADKVSIHPNPFTTSTTIQYGLTRPGFVTISIFNQFGEKVEVIQKHQSVGMQEVVWNAEGMQAGMYYFTIQANDKLHSGKMILID